MRTRRFLSTIATIMTAGALVTAALPNTRASGASNVASAAVRPFTIPLAGSTYLYADDGKCPDTIEVFKVTGTSATRIQTFGAGSACATSPNYFGANELAYSTAPRTKGACLVQASPNNGGGGAPGNVLSYRVNAGGYITGQVSQNIDPMGGAPDNVQITRGRFGLFYALVTTSSANGGAAGISSYYLGVGCRLTLVSSARDPQSSSDLPSSTLLSNGQIVGTDGVHTSLDAFSFNSRDGTLSYETATASQFLAPDSVAASGTSIFAGQALGAPAHAEEGTVASGGAITYVGGSPQSDASGNNGASSWFDGTNHNYVQGEQLSSSLGFYHASPFAFSQHVPLASNGRSTAFQQKGSVLFVLNNGATNDIEACTLTPGGSSGCAAIATLSSASGNQTGLASS